MTKQSSSPTPVRTPNRPTPSLPSAEHTVSPAIPRLWKTQSVSLLAIATVGVGRQQNSQPHTPPGPPATTQTNTRVERKPPEMKKKKTSHSFYRSLLSLLQCYYILFWFFGMNETTCIKTILVRMLHSHIAWLYRCYIHILHSCRQLACTMFGYLYIHKVGMYKKRHGMAVASFSGTPVYAAYAGLRVFAPYLRSMVHGVSLSPPPGEPKWLPGGPSFSA